MRRMLKAFVLGALLTAVAAPARASHYGIADVPSIIPAAEAAKLQKAGVTTTEDLLTKAGTGKDRRGLAKVSGLSAKEVLVIARRCDLLRVKGIGPEMVLLLNAAGVKTVSELAQKDPAALNASTDKANAEHHISGKPPTQPQFDDWIHQAKQLPVVLDAK